MKFKKIGKAKIDLKTHEWFIDGVKDRFEMSRRMIDGNKDIKEIRSTYQKVIKADTPSVKKVQKREEHFKLRKQYLQEWNDLLIRVFEEIRQESFTYPIPLRKLKDFNHPREWRHCLYKGFVYEWDKQGYSGETMMERIEEAEAPKVEPAQENPEI